ncbi:MAG: hypothetical protein KUA43_17320 [Hoeflea sp.]|uniref:hypothetical protein n=1 Tax=Hoeflea sp. TaxID=1940281 RepID=UPI001D660223|nr:hypothetical protein [Hoeflea sp.]MBU4529036.1 hypothetical protein [Alphaproteobacteria bacterium]MBU4543441.1 hypothetical protein [Alphaproteobacteria bacterium]MBU4549066.1 hypothetical protein [Alphaproteobacteria bacterium]MBV1725201.1 hypothetical protein [Hoeflea sp.]MBV1785162.1 hypothetical protein [Hoeflea sp.]
MNEQLFEIESWRGGWFYKFGSRYTGPFERRNDAILAGNRDLAPLKACQTTPVRGSLGHAAPFGDGASSDVRIGTGRRT